MSNVESKPEIERKFLVREADLSDAEDVKLFDIESVYLDMEELAKIDMSLAVSLGRPREIRVTRESERDGGTNYWSVSKVGGHSLVREEATIKIDKASFDNAVEKFGTSRIKKKRFKFTYIGNVFELDVFPDRDLLIMEIELKSEGQIFGIPPFVDIVKDVTGDPSYYNANMAGPIDIKEEHA